MVNLNCAYTNVVHHTWTNPTEMTVESIYAHILLYQYEFFKKTGRFRPIDLALFSTTILTALLVLPICAILTQNYDEIRTYIFFTAFGLLLAWHLIQKKLVTKEFLRRHKTKILNFESISLTRLRIGVICSILIIGTFMISLLIIFIDRQD